MTNSSDFTWWLKGFVELNDGEMPTPEQWQMIIEHLNLLFRKVTPPLKMPGSVIPNQEIKYCNSAFGKDIYFDGVAEQEKHYGSPALNVSEFKMPPGATGDIGNGIQIFDAISPYFSNGFSGQMSHEEYKDWLKRYNIVPLEYDKGAPLDYSQTLITC